VKTGDYSHPKGEKPHYKPGGWNNRRSPPVLISGTVLAVLASRVACAVSTLRNMIHTEHTGNGTPTQGRLTLS